MLFKLSAKQAFQTYLPNSLLTATIFALAVTTKSKKDMVIWSLLCASSSEMTDILFSNVQTSSKQG